MIRRPDGRLRFAPSDLITYLEGDFAAWMERLELERRAGTVELTDICAGLQGDPADPEKELVARQGQAFERRYLERLLTEGRQVVELDGRDRDALDRTLAAMRAGTEVIYQGHLAAEDFHGFPDFLVRIPGDSDLGPWHYEPWDTKLARTVRGYFLVQLSAYADLLESLQGRRPRQVTVVLGDGRTESFPTDEFFYYYRALRADFTRFQAGWDPARPPDPGLDRKHGDWTAAAAELLERADHLSRVAAITRNQVRRLEAAGIRTLTALAESAPVAIGRVAPEAFLRLRSQARLQRLSAGQARPAWECRPPDEARPRRGLALLPPPSPLDVFFDLEGFPYTDPPLEYLFGVVTVDRGTGHFRDWWAHDLGEEKRAFEGFIDWLWRRWSEDPALHLYHYAAYERTALQALMARHATREMEVDALLRGQVLVDLLQVVRQGLIVGTPTYSLKDVERLVAPPRTEAVTSAGRSVAEYQHWLDRGEPRDWRVAPTLAGIRDYNRRDCESTWLLRDWLLERQAETGTGWVPAGAAETAGPSRVTRAPDEAEQLAAAMLEQIESTPEGDPETRRVSLLLAYLLNFHRREEKPFWWRYYDLLDATEETWFEDPECLAGLRRTGTAPEPVKRSWIYEYRFDPDQESRIAAGDMCIFSHDPKVKPKVISVDEQLGLIRIRLTLPPERMPPELSLIRHDHVNSGPIRDAILRFVRGWLARQSGSPAVEDLLHRGRPRITGHPGGPLVDPAAELIAAATDLVARMDRTTLCIQGPPGSGKTYTAARIIAALLQQGKRIGITANSHKVILNLMETVLAAREELPFDAPLLKVGQEREETPLPEGITGVEKNEQLADALGDGAVVAGGTAWAFCRPELTGRLDYLFVDEAGQVSLANLVAMGPAARNLVLIGDQMQLAQPTQAVHPGDSGLSGLEYLLHGRATIPAELGLFLPVTRRMHPAVNAWVSEVMYDGRLRAHPDNARQAVGPADPRIPLEAGILFLPVEHEGNAQASDEEVEAIAGLVEALQGRHVTDRQGNRRPLDSANDLLFVAPYNLQVRRLRARLGPGARAGSVDRFQGQEAPVVIVSLCASSLEQVPRGVDFLLSPNRLNVAVSRAQALAIVVASPALLAARCHRVDEMRLVNRLCRLAAWGGGTKGEPEGGREKGEVRSEK